MLFDVEDKPFEIFALRVVYVDWMVGRLCQLVKNPYAASDLSCGRENGEAKLLFGNCLRAGEGEQNASFGHFFHCSGVEFLVAAEGVADCASVFRECGGVKYDEIVGSIRHFGKVSEGVDRKCFVWGVRAEVEFNIAVCQCDSFCRTVDRMDEGRTTAQGVD